MLAFAITINKCRGQSLIKLAYISVDVYFPMVNYMLHSQGVETQINCLLKTIQKIFMKLTTLCGRKYLILDNKNRIVEFVYSASGLYINIKKFQMK